MLNALLKVSYTYRNSPKEAEFLASYCHFRQDRLELDFFNSIQELQTAFKAKNSTFVLDLFFHRKKHEFNLQLENFNSTIGIQGLPVLQAKFHLEKNEHGLILKKIFTKLQNEKRKKYYLAALLLLLSSAFIAWFWQKNANLNEKNTISQGEIRLLEKKLEQNYQEKLAVEKALHEERKKKLEEEIETLKEGMKKIKLEFKDLLAKKEDELKKIEEQVQLAKKEVEVKQRREEAMNQFVGHLEERLFYFSVTSDSENILISGPADKSVLEDENYLRAKQLEQAKQYQASIPLFRQVAKDHPYSRWSYSGLARALYRNNQMNEARSAFAQYIRVMKVDHFRKMGFKMDY